MISTVVLVIVGAWLLLSLITTVACAALARGGLHEDRARGYAPIPEPREPVAHR
jgi:hypothetical protein